MLKPSTILSSSPAFATPVHPVRPHGVAPIPSVLPILLPPATLRPVAFRILTKKHGLTLTSPALQLLATFVGRNCGSRWREGLAEPVLEDVAKSWKRLSGSVIIDGEGKELKEILKQLDGNMTGGRILVRTDSQLSSVSSANEEENLDDIEEDPRKWLKVIHAFDQPNLVYNVANKHFDKYRDSTKPSLLPPPSHKTQLFRNRYNLVHQRLLRNEAFQVPSFERGAVPSLRRSSSSLITTQQSYKLTSIANLLGRHGSSHLLLGLLTIAPTGTLAINDLTGSIALDLTHAKMIPEDGAWFVPGMIVLVDGVYEEEDDSSTGTLGGGGGVGGTIGGKFVGFTVGGPPAERRYVTLGVTGSNDNGDITAGGGFGWVDFLGVGSERAIGTRMRKIEQRSIGRPSTGDESSGRARMVIMGEVNLDQPRCLQALKKLLGTYAAEAEEDIPMVFVLIGNFVQYAIMARGGSGGSIEYKEYFDALASTLSEFPTLLQSSTFVFVPGDNDGWASSFTAGAATPIPRKAVPEMFTSRIKRAFATANTDAEKETGRKTDGEAIWTSNPSRLSLFGPAHEIVLFRDDMSSRLRRAAIRFASQTHSDDIEMDTPATELIEQPPQVPQREAMDVDSAVEAAESHVANAPTDKGKNRADAPVSSDLHIARKLVKTIIDQGYLAPFRMINRPVLWDYASSLQLYPLPTALVLTDPEAPAFCITYEGCHVMNPGSIVAPGRRGVAKWVEYDVRRNMGSVKEALF